MNRHSGASRNPCASAANADKWIPTCVGMTPVGHNYMESQYHIADNTLTISVIRIGHRKDVYRGVG